MTSRYFPEGSLFVPPRPVRKGFLSSSTRGLNCSREIAAVLPADLPKTVPVVQITEPLNCKPPFPVLIAFGLKDEFRDGLVHSVNEIHQVLTEWAQQRKSARKRIFHGQMYAYNTAEHIVVMFVSEHALKETKSMLNEISEMLAKAYGQKIVSIRCGPDAWYAPEKIN